MAKLQKLPNGTWRIRWNTETGKRKSKTFKTFGEAKAQLKIYLAEIEEIKRGIRCAMPIDRTFNDLCDYWIEKRLPLKRPRLQRRKYYSKAFTPSSPAYKINPGFSENGVRTLEGLGFKIKLGSLTARRAVQGYRSGSGQERAAEFMDLITDPTVDALVSTIGGYNSNSMIPFLDFSAIRDARKPICGASDVTSLHLAIMKFSGLRTYYGPTVMCWFGDWPEGDPESTSWFLDALMNHETGVREVRAPARWSNHKRDWLNGDWKNKPRDWQKNQGWKVLQPGVAEAPITV